MCKLAFFWLLLFMPAIGIARFNEEPNASYPPEEISTKKSLSSSYTEINVDLMRTHPVSPMLYGLFFEEISHAGDGGLYAEMIQDRSFDAMARQVGFSNSADTKSDAVLDQLLGAEETVDTREVLSERKSQTREMPGAAGKTPHHKRAHATLPTRVANQEPAWQPYGDSILSLVEQLPKNPKNPIAMSIATSGAVGGIINTGYWGIPLRTGQNLQLTLYLRTLIPDPEKLVKVALESADGRATYSSATISGVGLSWSNFTAKFWVTDTDPNARLAITFPGPGILYVDSVSLFPAENANPSGGNPWPFRKDLLDLLRDLKPRFLRFPGGCYVEGPVLKDAFRWRNALGPNEERPGHMNSVWGYWSDDGLGLYEYMLLCEELGAEPVWVVNNGVSHTESVKTRDIWPWVQDALDSIEFIVGPEDSYWGSQRAAMGHPKPWSLNYFAIGNEDCGAPNYLGNYLVFFGALRAKYPHMRLIANCDAQDAGPTDLWDYHVYTDPQTMFDLRHTFDHLIPGRDAYIFASEYAVTTGGGRGNLIGAIAEAAFMTGLERNSEVVQMASYAPLFVNVHDPTWNPDLIVLDNSRAYGIPSYHVQKIFSKLQGTHYISTTVTTPPDQPEKIAASATCLEPSCSKIAVKVVNFAATTQTINITFSGAGAAEMQSLATLTVLTSAHPEDENSFDQPDKVSPWSSSFNGVGSIFQLQLHQYSLVTLEIDNSKAPMDLGITGSINSA